MKLVKIQIVFIHNKAYMYGFINEEKIYFASVFLDIFRRRAFLKKAQHYLK